MQDTRLLFLKPMVFLYTSKNNCKVKFKKFLSEWYQKYKIPKNKSNKNTQYLET